MDNLEIKRKQTLTKDLKDLIYDTQLKDIGVYSKQYFYSIIYSMYQTIPDEQNFCFTYGDFDGLGSINSIYGKEAGNIAVEECLKIIKETMPKGTIICRIAGDEFAFLTPGFTRNQIKPYIEEVYKRLKEASKEKTKGLSITLGSMDNHTFSDFNDLYTHSELIVTNEKRKSKEQITNESDSILILKCQASFSRFFAYYRFDDSTLPENFFLNLKNILLDKLDELANQEIKSKKSSTVTLKSISNTAQTHKQNIAEDIHTILTAPRYNSKDLLLLGIPEDDLQVLYEYLIRNPVTHQYSEKYFDRMLCPEIVNQPNKKLTIHHFDIMHMKLSNDLIGHEQTDIQMCELLNHIIKPVSEKNKNAIFVTRGGTLLLIEDAANATPEEDILKYIKEATQTNESHLDLAYTSSNCDSKNLVEAIKKLEDMCSIQKRKIKAEKIVDTETMKESLTVALKDPINYYLQNDKDSKSFKSLKNFFNTLFQSLVDVICEKQNKEKIFLDLRPSAFDERQKTKTKTEKSLDD